MSSSAFRRLRASRSGKPARTHRFGMEALESRHLLTGNPVISEFSAAGQTELLDEDDFAADWIEIFNAGTSDVNLEGYSLTDDATNLDLWQFPSVNLPAGGYLVVFASGKDRAEVGEELHTNFQLSSSGEYLALIEPDGETIATEFAPAFPPQASNVSYGFGISTTSTELLGDDGTAKYLVPNNSSLEQSWNQISFDDSSWSSGTVPLGYDTGASEPFEYGATVDSLGPAARWTFDGNSVVDVTGTIGNGTAVGVTYVDSPMGRAISMAQSFDFGLVATTVANFDRLKPTSELTVAVSVQRVGSVGDLISLGDHYRLRLNADGTLEFAVDDSATASSWTSVTTSVAAGETIPTDGNYHLVVARKTTTGLDIWIDGEQTSAVTTAAVQIDYAGLGTSLYFGRNGFTNGNNFGGRLDDVTIWDRALSDGEMQAIGGRQLVGGFDPYTATDVQTAMANVNSSIYARIPFQVDDPSDYNQLFLSMKYDDGFVAFINGQEVMRMNAPELGEEEIDVYNATATHRVVDFSAIAYEQFDISDARDSLVVGENILAIQGLNVSASDADFLMSARIDGGFTSLDTETVGYLTVPTPGEVNVPSSGVLGPVIDGVTDGVPDLQAGEAVVVTAVVGSTLNPVTQVDLKYRVMFGSEVTIPMNDAGTGGDLTAGDGIYSATIPGGVAQPGEMLRWYVTAADTLGASAREPKFLFNTGNNQSPQYFGTMVQDSTVSSNIAVIHWFSENTAATGTRAGTRASLFYNGEFYDNAFVRQRGGSTAASAESRGKTNYKFDFKGDTFRFDPNFGRVEEFNLNSTASDKAYIRQPLAFEAYSLIGVASSISFPVHVQRNNTFYGVFAFIEEPDANMLEREGLDPNGALYKSYHSFTPGGSVRKKTREDEGRQDMDAFLTSVNSLTGEALSDYLFDNLDIPAMLNYHVATVITHQNDNPHKNHFLYRDTEGTGEWQFIPWDHDLTWGSNWVGTSYSDTMYADDDSVPGRGTVVKPSHPFVNDEDHREWNNNWNRLTNAIYNDERLREMYLRRLRTIMDELLGSPDVDPESTYFNQRLNDYLGTMSEDAAADKAFWQLNWGQSQTFEQAVNIIKEEYLAVRRIHLFETHNIDNLENQPAGPVTLIPEVSVGSYLVPSNNSLGTTWTGRAFDDSAWATGTAGFGYENAPGLLNASIRTRVKPSETNASSTSIFVRMPFEISDLETLHDLTLKVKYDDAYVAYLNGTELVRRNFTGTPAFNSVSGFDRLDVLGSVFETVDITSFANLLVEGENVLAFHAINSSAANNNQIISAELIRDLNVPRNDDVAGIPHAQPTNPQINFDTTTFDASPVSGNQDEEFLKLDNPNATAIDISGWRLEGGVTHTFRPGTVIPAGDSLYVTPNSPAFRARATGPSGGQGLFVQDGYNGNLSAFGETVQLVAPDGTVISSFEVPADTSEVQDFLRISEIHYNPDGSDVTEFIELMNISSGDNAVTLDLTGVTITDGGAGNEAFFSFANGTTLAPGAYLLVVANQAAFTAAYPSVSGALIAGQANGSLSNGGERIKVNDAGNNTAVDVTYGDSDPWPSIADGSGPSLVLVDPAGTGQDTMDKPYSWRASTALGGSPGVADPASLGVVVNEVRTNTDDPGKSDAIELYNTTASDVDLSGWYLTDGSPSASKFVIPNGTAIAPGGYLVFDESDFNPTPEAPELTHFSLNGAHGDSVALVNPNGSGGVVLLSDYVSFDAALPGQTIGRYPGGSGRLTTLTRDSIGHANSTPFASDVIMSEVNYHPGLPLPAAVQIHADLSRNDLEYVELYNSSSSSVDLSNWQLRGGADFDFVPGTTLGAGEVVLVISFNPESVSNGNRLAAFRTHYGLDNSVRLLGNYSGDLSDSTEAVRLERADAEPADEPGFIPHVTSDELLYDDRRDWPMSADGDGSSLQRVAPGLYGNLVTSWSAATPTPGTVSFSVGVPGDVTGDGVVNVADIDRLTDVVLQGATNLAFDLDSSGAVDQGDRSHLVLSILGTLFGDTNLDRVVDVSDFNPWNASKFQNVSSWGQGDFSGDGVTDGTDFNLWNTNRFQAAAPAAAASRTAPRAALAAKPQVVDSVFATDASLYDSLQWRGKRDSLRRRA